MLTQTLEAAEWWARPRGEANGEWISNYQNSLKSAHRLTLSAIVGQLQPQSVLEVGSHCGPNLVRLATDHPSITELCGLDVNEQAIEAGRNWIAAKGLSARIALRTAAMTDVLPTLSDGSADVVLSCYALAYIAPFDVDAILYEMGRIARKGIVIAEPMASGPSAEPYTQLNGYQEWAHNYNGLSRFLGTWHGFTLKTAILERPVDRLERVLVAVRDSGARNTP